MAMRQILTLARSMDPDTGWELNVAGHLTELPGLVVSVLAALSVVFLERFITQHREDEAAIREREEELRQAQKMEAVGQLAGGIAHDFNNLLTVILANVEMLRLAPGDGLRQERSLGQLETAAMRASALTRQLLMFARKQKPERKVQDLDALIADLRPMMRSLVDERVELAFEPGGALPKAEFDPTQLGQVLINLVVNAQHAIEGQGVITVRTRAVDDPRLEVDRCRGACYGSLHSYLGYNLRRLSVLIPRWNVELKKPCIDRRCASVRLLVGGNHLQ